MSEVRPGGDSSDSIAEMTGPQNLQKTEVNGSMQERHKDNNTTEKSDSSITLSSEDAKTKSLQPQFETDTPIVRTDNAEEIDNTATYDRVEAKGSSASIVHIRQLFVGNVWFLFQSVMYHVRSIHFDDPATFSSTMARPQGHVQKSRRSYSRRCCHWI